MDFIADHPAGHGSHTAGSAAGATLASPARTQNCAAAASSSSSSSSTPIDDIDSNYNIRNAELSCVGGCIDPENSLEDTGEEGEGDDLVPSWEEDVYGHAPFDPIDLDRLCPKYHDCTDGENAKLCLGGDPAATLTEHGGIARGAKLAIFDALKPGTALGIALAGNGVRSVWAQA